MAESTGDIIAGLWENGRDSITHALDHFSEREAERSNRRRHDKWIVLSLHHAAECVCNMRRLGLDPSRPLFSRKGEVWFPSLSETIKQLQQPINAGRLSPTVHQLFHLLSEVPISGINSCTGQLQKSLDVFNRGDVHDRHSQTYRTPQRRVRLGHHMAACPLRAMLSPQFAIHA
jgi:hypothetical protein